MRRCVRSSTKLHANGYRTETGESGRQSRAGFQDKEAGWKLSRKIKGQTQDIHEWKFRNETVTFSISELASTEEATRRLQQSIALIATGDMKRLPSLGDEAYYRTGDSPSTSTIHFRKGNVFVIVNAPSMSLARRFAKDIEKEMDNN